MRARARPAQVWSQPGGGGELGPLLAPSAEAVSPEQGRARALSAHQATWTCSWSSSQTSPKQARERRGPSNLLMEMIVTLRQQKCVAGPPNQCGVPRGPEQSVWVPFSRCPPTHPQALAAGPEAGGLGPCTPDAQQDWPEMANLSPTKACDLRFSGSPAWPPAPHGLLWAPAHLLQPRFYRRGT